MAAKPSPAKTAAVFAVGFPYFLIRGVGTIVHCARRAHHAVRGLRLGLAKELRCPHGHLNSTVGRWECGSCKGTYIGWLGKCGVCGAGASWFPCATCGVSVLVPWERQT